MRSADLAPPSCDSSLATSTPLPRTPWVIFIHSGAVATAQIHTRPPLESVFEGQELVLVCSVRGVSGPIGISWYRRPKPLDVATEIPSSPEAEFRISTVKSSDAGEYYCVANTSFLTFASRTVSIRVRGVSFRYHLREGLSSSEETARGGVGAEDRVLGEDVSLERRKVRGRALRSTWRRGK